MDNQPAGNNPWADPEAHYQPGQEVRGTVTRVTQFGVFVEIEPGMEGILYAFELGQGPSALAGFARGQQMQLYVKSIEVGKKRLELSLQNRLVPGLLGEKEAMSVVRQGRQVERLHWPVSDQLMEQDECCCSTCQRSIQAAWKYCVYCGRSLRRRCPTCGTVQPDLPEARYCCECGKSL